MSEQVRKISYRAIPEWAEGLYYNSGIMSEVLVYQKTSQSTSSTRARRAA